MSLSFFAIPTLKAVRILAFQRCGVPEPLSPCKSKYAKAFRVSTWRHSFGATQTPKGNRTGRGNGRKAPVRLSALTLQIEQSQLCSRPKSTGHLTCDTSGEDTEPLRGHQLSKEDWVRLRIRPRLSCMLAEAGCLHPMQATPPADLYFRRLPGMIWKTKNAVVTCSFPPCNCGSRDS